MTQIIFLPKKIILVWILVWMCVQSTVLGQRGFAGESGQCGSRTFSLRVSTESLCFFVVCFSFSLWSILLSNPGCSEADGCPPEETPWGSSTRLQMFHKCLTLQLLSSSTRHPFFSPAVWSCHWRDIIISRIFISYFMSLISWPSLMFSKIIQNPYKMA